MTEDSLEIIKMLREARLSWIADELVESLALGRQTFKEFREPGSARTTKATTIEPFSPEQEMELIVETLAQYFIVVPAAWTAARARFAKSDTFGEVQIEGRLSSSLPLSHPEHEIASVTLGIAADGEEIFRDFGREYQRETLPALRAVLKKLLPAGAEAFDEKFDAPEERGK